ncbi:hypothetical protein H0H81_003351, partial [Sphagnurus paluster]
MASPSLLAGNIEAELANACAAYTQKDAARLAECLNRLCIFVPLWRAYPLSEQAVWPAAEAQLVGLHQLIITSKVTDRYPLFTHTRKNVYGPGSSLSDIESSDEEDRAAITKREQKAIHASIVAYHDPSLK